MKVSIKPLEKGLYGTISTPPSKSYSHRVFIAAALSNGISIIRNPLVLGDVSITLDILSKLGSKIQRINNSDYSVKGIDFQKSICYNGVIDCGNSGTSIRIFSALSLLIKGGLKFQGEFLERKRPIIPLLDSLKQLGGRYEFKDDIFHIYRESSECNSKILVPGDITSQFITALLFLCPILQCDRRKSIRIQSSTPLVSYPYIKISLDVITKFQINILEKYQKDKVAEYVISLGQTFKEQEFLIPGDFSSAAFIIAATILSPFNSKVKILNLDISNPQGDKEFIEIIKKMGAKIEINSDENSLLVYGNIQENPLKGISIDCKSIPDLFPILSIIGMFAKGKTILYNAMTLRNKESDRISVMSRELRKMDVKVIEKKDSLTIFPIKKKPLIKEMNHENDHRVAMALIVASLFGQVPTLIENVEIIKDSYPRFIEDLINLGVKISRIKN